MIRKILINDTIFSLSHGDCDGCVSQILLGNVFKNIYYLNTSFGKVDEYIKQTDYTKFDHVFLTDLYPNDRSLIDFSDKIILIDHHDTQLQICDPKKMRFVDNARCASSSVKAFLEVYFKINMSQFNELVKLTNDYDMWHLKYPESKMLADLYWYYKPEAFRKRFFDGNVNFNSNEIDYLNNQKRKYDNVYNNLDGIDFESVKGCLIFGVNEFTNDICNDLITKENYKIVFIKIGDTSKVSVRHNINGLHIGNMLLNFGLGGGHANAAGMLCSRDPKELSNQIQRVLSEIYEKFPEARIK